MRCAFALLLVVAAIGCSGSRAGVYLPWPDGGDSGTTGDDKPEDTGEAEQPLVECEAAVAEAVVELDASLIEEGDVAPWCSEAESEPACLDSRDTPEAFVAQSERGCSTWTATGRDFACLPTWVDGKCCAEVIFGAPDHEGCDE